MEKGKQTEEIVRKYLENEGYKVMQVLAKREQMEQGDLISFSSAGKKQLIEVKTSNSFNNEPKLSIDILYFTKDNKNYYKQSTNGYKGWLYTNKKTDILMAYNYETEEIYKINNYQMFKRCIQIAIETHIRALTNNLGFIEYEYPVKASYFVTSECKDRKHNKINEHLELFNNKNDKCKNTLIASVPLTEKAVKYFGGQLEIISVNSNLDNKKSLVTAITRPLNEQGMC